MQKEQGPFRCVACGECASLFSNIPLCLKDSIVVFVSAICGYGKCEAVAREQRYRLARELAKASASPEIAAGINKCTPCVRSACTQRPSSFAASASSQHIAAGAAKRETGGAIKQNVKLGARLPEVNSDITVMHQLLVDHIYKTSLVQLKTAESSHAGCILCYLCA